MSSLIFVTNIDIGESHFKMRPTKKRRMDSPASSKSASTRMLRPTSGEIPIQQTENTIEPRFISYLEILLGVNCPPGAPEAVLQVLAPHDVTNLRQTCKAISQNPVLKKVDSNPFHQDLLQGFCRMPVPPPLGYLATVANTTCFRSHHNRREAVKACATHPGDKAFPICSHHIHNQKIRSAEKIYGEILFGLCEDCDAKLRSGSPKRSNDSDVDLEKLKEDIYFQSYTVELGPCECATDLIPRVYPPWRCCECAEYHELRVNELAHGRRCEECFPSLEKFLASKCEECGIGPSIWQRYPTDTCDSLHNRPILDGNNACRLCSARLSVWRKAELLEGIWPARMRDYEAMRNGRVKGGGDGAELTWRTLPVDRFLFCARPGCGGIVRDPRVVDDA